MYILYLDSDGAWTTGWEIDYNGRAVQVDSDLLANASTAFSTLADLPSPSSSSSSTGLIKGGPELGQMFARDAGAQRNAMDLRILQLPRDALAGCWEACIARAMEARIAVDEEVRRALSAQVRWFLRYY